MILQPGEFDVKDYRKAIPAHVKVQAVLNLIRGGEPPDWMFWTYINAIDLEYDHDPALVHRQYDTEAGDFIPAQNDPKYIVPRIKSEHRQKTFGRKADAEMTVTTRGSDIGEASRTKKIRNKQELHQLKMECKRGNPEAIAKLLQVERRQKPKSRWPKRSFSRAI